MDVGGILVLVAAGLVGGAANALAGGGTFFTFPAMLEVGLPPVAANASNAVALYPGRFPSVLTGRRELAAIGGARLARSCLVAALGSLAGAWLLLASGERLFGNLVPWLLLFATVLFASGPWIAGNLKALSHATRLRGMGLAASIVFETMVAVYGGYFGAGAAFMVMAGNALTGIDDIRRNVAFKNLLIILMTTVSVVTFIAAGAVDWRATLIMVPAAVIGGYFGAVWALRVSSPWLRRAVIAVGGALSAYYFVKVYA